MCSGTTLDGAKIEVVLAKPPDKARPRYTRSHKSDTPVKASVSLLGISCLSSFCACTISQWTVDDVNFLLGGTAVEI